MSRYYVDSVATDLLVDAESCFSYLYGTGPSPVCVVMTGPDPDQAHIRL